MCLPSEARVKLVKVTMRYLVSGRNYDYSLMKREKTLKTEGVFFWWKYMVWYCFLINKVLQMKQKGW